MSEDIERIAELEAQMQEPTFWNNKDEAQKVIKELQALKTAPEAGSGPYDSGGAVITIFAGAGGDDAEDFAHMLLVMYQKYISAQSWGLRVLHENTNDHGGYRNVTIEIDAHGAYGTLKNESGVHRLVRVSPFNAKKLRHTSFAMVEVVPLFKKEPDLDIPPQDIKIEFAKSSGPGGQNVNKRETAVRTVHIPTNISAHSESERSQAQNKEKALQLLKAKIYRRLEDERLAKERGMQISKTTSIDWGNQIRSYVLHPYKMVKDHRTNVEVRDVDTVLEGGLEPFIAAERTL